MIENNKTSFSVLDMVDEYAATNDINAVDIFKKEVSSEPVQNTESNSNADKKKPWVPDASLIADMEEFSGPVTYAKDEIKVEDTDKSLKNISDDNALKDSIETMNELDRKQANIEAAKKRHGIKNFQIPEGEYYVTIFAAAGDTNYTRAQEKLDVIFNEIKEVHPEFILDWIDKNPEVKDISVDEKEIVDTHDEQLVEDDLSNSEDVKVIIDKTQLDQVSWSDEEISKIKKSRTVELNIVESTPIEFSEIEDVEDNLVDMVLAPYQRKYNDTVISLPASRYRATITGLSYAELTDLSTSVEMNTIDAERKKWSICFDHIKNQSIGPWESYRWYIDPITKQKVRLEINDNAPNHINANDIHLVTKFDDFLMKTSYLDLEFIIWKILCATAMDSEIISITCHAMNNGKACNKTYDWVYNPAELLDMESIEPAVLDEMKVTGEVATKDDILKHYNASALCSNNTVKLRSSGMHVIFGHISAYDYLTEVYGIGQKLTEMIESEDPSSISKSYNTIMLRSIKGFLIPKDNGKYARITGSDNVLKVIESLDEVDWQTIFEITKLMLNPYEFKYSFRNLVCPSCHNKSSITIESMTQLLFIVAQSLSSVQVVLKRT